MKMDLAGTIAVVLMGVGVWQATAIENVLVAADRVNIRATASLDSEVVGQCSDGEVLQAKALGEEWVEIVPPSRLGLWVYRGLVQEGAVTVSKLKVRAGPGFLYSEVGMLGRGDKVTVRKEVNDWLQIEPPDSCSLWISRKYVKAVAPPTSVPPPAAPSPTVRGQGPAATAQAVTNVPPPTARAAAPPEDLVAKGLIPLEGQGKRVQMEGIVQPAGYLLGPPTKYRLVEKQAEGYRTLCHLKGNNAQLASFAGRRLLVSGREYWIRGLREPVLVPEQITPK